MRRLGGHGKTAAALVLGHIRSLFGSAETGEVADIEFLDRFCRKGDEKAFAALVQRHSIPGYLLTCFDKGHRNVGKPSLHEEHPSQVALMFESGVSVARRSTPSLDLVNLVHNRQRIVDVSLQKLQARQIPLRFNSKPQLFHHRRQVSRHRLDASQAEWLELLSRQSRELAPYGEPAHQ
jgi:hypothetical protein